MQRNQTLDVQHCSSEPLVVSAVVFPTLRLWRFYSIHHKMFLVRHLGNDTPFYRSSFGTELADMKLQDCFLITKGFQLLSWLPLAFYTSISSCVQYVFPASFLIITLNLWKSMIWCLCTCRLDGLLATSGENCISVLCCSDYIISAVSGWNG